MRTRNPSRNRARRYYDIAMLFGSLAVIIAVAVFVFAVMAFRERSIIADSETGAAEAYASTNDVQSEPSVGQPATADSAALLTQRGGRVIDSDGLLTPGQQALLTDYFTRYYESLRRLEATDAKGLFCEETQGELNQAVWQYICGARALQKVDLSLVSYEYLAAVESVKQNADKSVSLTVIESAEMVFAAYPNVTSEMYGTEHEFTLAPASSGTWLISLHYQDNALYDAIGGQYAKKSASDPTAAASAFAANAQELLNSAARSIASRAKGDEGSPPALSVAYDRDAAVAYANQYVGARNASYADHSAGGGNCQNFASQCLAAGSLAADRRSSLSWIPESGCWVGVNSFLSYLKNAGAGGIAALANAPYYNGEKGDIIAMGLGDEYQHVVIITDVVSDEAGETVDYLIASNTTDLRRFPLSAYTLQNQMLIRVYGTQK